MEKSSYSTIGFKDIDLGTALDLIAAAGFDRLELSALPHVPDPLSVGTASRLRRQLEGHSLIASTFHAPMRRNVLGPPSEDWRREKSKVLGDYVRLAGDVGAQGIVIHTVPNPMFLPSTDIAAFVKPMQDAAKRSLDELVPVAAAAGVRILIENLPYVVEESIDYPLITMGQLLLLADCYPAKQVGLVLDTGHAWTLGIDPISEVEIAAGRLWGTHLQDVDADDPQDNHWLPGHGGLDWPGICAALRRVGYAGDWTFEVINGRNGESQAELACQARAIACGWGDTGHD